MSEKGRSSLSVCPATPLCRVTRKTPLGFPLEIYPSSLLKLIPLRYKIRLLIRIFAKFLAIPVSQGQKKGQLVNCAFSDEPVSYGT